VDSPLHPRYVMDCSHETGIGNCSLDATAPGIAELAPRPTRVCLPCAILSPKVPIEDDVADRFSSALAAGRQSGLTQGPLMQSEFRANQFYFF